MLSYLVLLGVSTKERRLSDIQVAAVKSREQGMKKIMYDFVAKKQDR